MIFLIPNFFKKNGLTGMYLFNQNFNLQEINILSILFLCFEANTSHTVTTLFTHLLAGQENSYPWQPNWPW